MTEKQYFEIAEKRLDIFNRDNWRCVVCGRSIYADGSIGQLAHMIPKTKANLKKYGEEVIHHHLNLKTVCGLKCNSAVNMGNKPIQISVLVKRIQNDLKGARE